MNDLSKCYGQRRCGRRACVLVLASLPLLLTGLGGCGSDTSSGKADTSTGATSPDGAAGSTSASTSAGAGGTGPGTEEAPNEPPTAAVPSFKKFAPDETFMATRIEGESTTYFSYVENTGSSGTATIAISLQNRTETETLQVPVEAWTQYVLGSTFTTSAQADGAAVESCYLYSRLPDLPLDRYIGTTPTPLSTAECPVVEGQTTSFLIPLSSCGCDGWFELNGVIYTNCGLRTSDPDCCNACAAGTTCNSGICK